MLSVLAAALGVAYGYWGRDYPWPFAVVLGSAVGALVWAVQRTTDRLRER